MSQVTVSLPADGTTADVADYSTPFTALLNDHNGNIDNSNIAANAAIAGSKLASASVDSTRIDFGGAGAGIWWQEIGRTTLSVAGDTISVTGITAKKYLMIIISFTATGGTADTKIRFNNDSGANYCQRSSTDLGASASLTSQSSIILRGAGTDDISGVVNVVNVATREKLVIAHVNDRSTAGAANVPSSVDAFAKWTNTADQITRVDLVNGGTGDFAIGSEIVVLGHN